MAILTSEFRCWRVRRDKTLGRVISESRQHAVRDGLMLVSTLVLVACGGGDATAPTANNCAVAPPNGTVTATVDGEPFVAALTAQATIQNSTPNAPNIVQVNGVACPAGAGASARQILFTIGRLTPITPGTYLLDAASQSQPPQSGYSGIGLVALAPNLWHAHLSDNDGPGSGSITFTTITATRLTGTFQLVAVATPSNASAARERVTVTSGAFDVSIP